MPCDIPQIATLPLLGCCGTPGSGPAMDYVVRTIRPLFVFDPFVDPPNQQLLDQAFDQMLADEFIEGGKINGIEGAFAPPLGHCYTAIIFATLPIPIPLPPQDVVILQQRAQATHGYFKTQFNDRTYYAGKVRWRTPSPRRWCVESCEHVIAPQNACGESFQCDAPGGNSSFTLFPPTTVLEVIPNRLVIVDRPFTTTKHDFTWKRAFMDTDPPSSPFCGLP